MKVNVISDTQQEFNGVTYYKCGPYFQKKGKRLHREVWIYHNGTIPKGYHIHHMDGNKSNNGIDNLELIKGSRHLSVHMNTEKAKEHSKKQIEKIRPLAAEWHRSAKGREWHSELAKKTWKTWESKTYKCTQCGKEFETKHHYNKNYNTFCSNNCKSQYRRESGIDDIVKICACCGGEFKANKYAKAKCCSVECSRKLRWSK